MFTSLLLSAWLTAQPVPEYYDYHFLECFPRDHWWDMMHNHKQPEGEEGWEINHLTDEEFNSLDTRQLISYFSYPEEFSQNCEAGEFNQTARMAIDVYLYDSEPDADHSERQVKALVARREEVLQMVKECATQSERYPDVMKQIVVELKGWEHIPMLIKTYEDLRIKEPTYLTALLRLMADDEWTPFLQSSINKEMEQGEWEIPFNSTNEQLIISQAKAYHASKKKAK